MKKFIALFLFFSLLALSGNLFAQDESSFTENFSLSTRSGIYGIFWSPRTSLAASNSFYIEKETYPKLNLAHQIPGTRQFFERTHPLRNATSKMEGRYGGEIYNYKYGLQKEQRSEVTSPSLAEVYLKQLATKSKTSRKKGGNLMLVGGELLTFAGVIALSEKEEGWFDFSKMFGTAYLIMGGIGVGSGILYLTIPSGAERKLEKVQSISDLKRRERMCHNILSGLAKTGRRNRIVTGIISSAFATYIFARSLKQESKDYFGAALCGALAVRDFIRKNPAEKAYRDYLKESKQRKELALSIGIGPHGGVKLGLSLSY